MMRTLTIVPLSTPQSIGESAKQAVLNAPRLFLQTAEHESARFIIEAGLEYTSMDDLYASSEDFDALNCAIAARLVCGENAVYAVPGRGVGSAQYAAISQAASAAGVQLIALPGTGFADAALASAGITVSGIFFCTANELPQNIQPDYPLCIEELDTPLRAGEVKLALGEYYPDEHPVLLFFPAAGSYMHVELPLHELDRQNGLCSSCVLYVPMAGYEQRDRFSMEDLHTVLARLRAPGGCPWDAEQTHMTLRSSLIEETYEVLDAIDREDMPALCEELGDLLLQVVFHAGIEEERREFSLRDVYTGIVGKLIYRHPHVFGDAHANTPDEVLANWEQLKKKEKRIVTQSQAMHEVPAGLPSLMRSAKVQKKAAQVGFDWDDANAASAKIYEEADELCRAMEQSDPSGIDEELGDLLFSVVNVARLLKRDPELLLRAATDKFIARFERMEQRILSDGKQPKDMTLAEMDVYWEKEKHSTNDLLR